MGLSNTDGYYISGTVAITNNTKALVGTGTAWSTAGIKKGYKFYAGGFGPVIVDTVTDNTHITLLDNWTFGTLSGAAYELEPVSTGAALLSALGYLSSLLVSQTLTGWSAVTGAANKVGYFTGAGTLALADFGASARDFLAIGASRSNQIDNLGLAVTVSANALLIALKQADGATDASATLPITAGLRSSTAASGAFNARKVTGALGLTAPSGATLGSVDNTAIDLYAYLIDNAGTLEIAVSATDFGASGIVSTTAMTAGSGTAGTMYSASARSNVPFRRIGSFTTTEVVAGTWATAPSSVKLDPFGAQETSFYKSLKALASATAVLTLLGFSSFVQGIIGSADAVSFRNATGALGFGDRLSKTAAYPVVSADDGKIIALSGNAYYALTFSTASGYGASHKNIVVNKDAWSTGRAKWIVLAGGTSFYLWPQQSVIVYNDSNAWQVIGQARAKLPASLLNAYSDFTNGTDTVGATDGLATGAGAFKTAHYAVHVAHDEFDWRSNSQTNVQINMAAFTRDTSRVHASPGAWGPGAHGGDQLRIYGAENAITGAANNGSGLVRLTLASTTGYTTNDRVMVFGVGGTTEANGCWQITVIDSTHIDLQATTFSNAYTSGGTITAGSEFNVNGFNCIEMYFGAVFRFRSVGFSSSLSALSLQWGSHCLFDDGCWFANRRTFTSAMIFMSTNAQLQINGRVGIAWTAPYFIICGNGGCFDTGGTCNIDFLPGLTCSFTVFALAAGGGRAIFNGVTITVPASTTVTGKRAQADNLGLVSSATGVPNTFFPGNANFTTSGGGQVL